MKILVAEDDPTSAYILEQILMNEGYEVSVVHNGEEALDLIKNDNYEALLTDWMMPKMNGIELVKRVRAEIRPSPVIMLITALSSKEARNHAIESGADEFLSKPVYPNDVLDLLKKCFDSRTQTVVRPVINKPIHRKEKAPFVSVVIGASSGGPPALMEIFKNMPITDNAAYFLVLHGPGWMLETFAETLAQDTQWPVKIAEDGMIPKAGEVYIAPGDHHLEIEEKSYLLKLNKRPMENYSRPSIDPLFRSAAKAFGSRCIGIILTGMGCDGSMGSIDVAEAGGVVVVQNPKTSTVGAMPQRVIDLGVAKDVLDLNKISSRIRYYIGKV